MIKNENDEIQIIMDTLIKRNDNYYLIIIATNKSCDFVIILVQQSSFIYTAKYYLKDFKKMNFFKNYLFFGLNQYVEVLKNLFKEKKNQINIDEEENKLLKLSIDIEISIVGVDLNPLKDKIEIILENDKIEKNLENNIIWHNILYLFQEKEKIQNKLLEQENIIKHLKQNLETKEITQLFNENNNIIKNDLNKSKIITDFNNKNFEFIQKRIKLFNKNKKLNFQLLYSAKIDGEKALHFHELCDNHKNTLILIKTDSNNIFGGFARKYWNSLELGRKRDLKSFLFSFDKQKIYNAKPESKYHLFCSDNDGPCFYAFSVNNYCLQNGGFCDEIYKCSYDSFENDYELNNGIKSFKIEELEIYEVKYI